VYSAVTPLNNLSRPLNAMDVIRVGVRIRAGIRALANIRVRVRVGAFSEMAGGSPHIHMHTWMHAYQCDYTCSSSYAYSTHTTHF
jgi:hypothetical protein